ncbi:MULTISPECIES: carbon storage regulator [Xanthomonas]|uniref:carbon storage regulator n=1 Tax=Xanthomonas TaxID=338 RepID=UPI001C43F359|nr:MULTISPECIES: carbon storage regulator [Xanthomonas]MBV6855894.1 carbon storage regulator [Xanthomonas campestris pv. mirabilis]MBV6867875.1 carbon storage regulator [Xanthomonas campestris pv. coriandri]MCE4330795.1 carbon storage regulator [Xanthomonas campestris pv. coriandri]MEA9776938.1 carbon storage regulator [Xanthomonas campestris pv. raphani]
MLVLTRNVNQTVLIGDDIALVICSTHHNKAVVGVCAPAHMRIMRKELVPDGQTVQEQPDLRTSTPRPGSTMLKLERMIEQGICIGNDITVWITSIDRMQVKLSFDVPRSMVILRKELTHRADKAAALNYLRAAAC